MATMQERITALAQAVGADIKALQAGGGGGATDVDGNAVKLQIKSLTRAQLEAAATGGTLAEGEPYLITDEGRMAVGISATEYSAFLLEGEGGAPIDRLRAPENMAPAGGAITTRNTETLICKPYYSSLATPQEAAQFQLHTSSDFTAPMHDSGVVSATDRHVIPAGLLTPSTQYHWRGRYKSLLGQWSEWSNATGFSTAAVLTYYIEVPTPTPAEFGDPLEGGFYAGMIWNELVQSVSSTTIGTGTKTFAVPSMSSTPIVYAGQTLEVRSRANPVNKMIGTVTDADVTTLTLNVTSVGGSGTFSDWSIMSRYRVIVAPKAAGENASIALKNASTALPVACQTLAEGWRATESMRLAGNSTSYPAAHWARGLLIGGKTDWHIPARDEKELCWRNLKPTTENNQSGAGRPTSPTFSYQGNGSHGDTVGTHGTNNNSAPAGAAYSTTVPSQVAATAFRTGGAEALEYGASNYWTSSDYNVTDAWYQSTYAAGPGSQITYPKTSAFRVRAVRRSII